MLAKPVRDIVLQEDDILHVRFERDLVAKIVLLGQLYVSIEAHRVLNRLQLHLVFTLHAYDRFVGQPVCVVNVQTTQVMIILGTTLSLLQPYSVVTGEVQDVNRSAETYLRTIRGLKGKWYQERRGRFGSENAWFS